GPTVPAPGTLQGAFRSPGADASAASENSLVPEGRVLPMRIGNGPANDRSGFEFEAGRGTMARVGHGTLHADLGSDGGGATWTDPVNFSSDDVSTSDDPWWFNGAMPTYYSTQVYLESLGTWPYPGNGTTLTWTITSGSNIVQFDDGHG